jgi:putative hydrolase of the HAD superfamily
MVELFEDGERRRVFDRTLLQIGVEPEQQLISRLVDVYRHHRPSISLADDAISFLHWASGKYKLGIVTDGYGPMQRNKVEALGVQPWMDVIVYSDDLGREHWKPSSQPFQEALRIMAVQPAEAIYVADNPHKDFVGARSLGMGTVRIRRVGGLHTDTTLDAEHEADYEVYTLLDLIHLLTTDRGVEA